MDIASVENQWEAFRHVLQGGSYPSGEVLGEDFRSLALSLRIITENFLLEARSLPSPYKELHLQVEHTTAYGCKLVRDHNRHPDTFPLVLPQEEFLQRWYTQTTGTFPFLILLPLLISFNL